MRTLHKTLIAIALASALVCTQLDFAADASGPAKAEAEPAVVGVAPAVRTRFAPLHWAPGTIISRQDARVASEQDGRVVRVAQVGQQVSAGEALAILDDTALRLREREGEADLARIQAQLDLATRQEQRYAQLAAQQNIARAQYDQQRADRDALVQDRARAQALLAQTRHQRAQMWVRAPFTGVVVERQVQLGEYVGTGAPVARLVDTHAPEVRVRAPIELAEHLAVGTQVQLRTGKDEGLRRISALVPVGDEASRQLELRIALEDGAPPVGSAVEVGLPRALPREVVAVPRDAVVLRREGSFVLRVDGEGRAERLPVKTVEEVAGMVAIEGAVAPGDRLIVRGGERVEPGQAVTIRDWSEATAMR